MDIRRRSLLAAPIALVAAPGRAEEAAGLPPRHETLILENPEGTIRNAGWFNIWTINAGGQSTGLQQLAMDTLWYLDPEHGLKGIWENSLAAEPPIYNADFTEMTVKLSPGIFWSDGVEFSADDVVYTVQTQIKNTAMRWGGLLALNVAEVTAPDPHTGAFQAEPGQFALPRAVHGAVERRLDHAEARVRESRRSDAVRLQQAGLLGAYALHSFDPEGGGSPGSCATIGSGPRSASFGKPGPQYVSYIDPGPPDKRVIAQLNHDLDVIHDVAPEGMFTLARQSKTLKTWFPKFPYAHPDPTLPALIFNLQNPMFADRRTRWALALLIDIKAVSMASYRGAATISAIGIPPTGTHPEDYHRPMQDWLVGYEVDTGKRKIRPYDPSFGKQIADMVRPSQPGRADRPGADRTSFGLAGGSRIRRRRPSCWRRPGSASGAAPGIMPDGKPFTIRVVVEGESRPVMTRAGTMIAQNWRQFGIDASTEVAQGAAMLDRRNAGDFETLIAWSVESYGGHPDLAYFLDSWHSQFVAPPGKPQAPRNYQRWASPEFDAIIEKIRRISFDDPKVVEYGRDYVKLAGAGDADDSADGLNVFTAMDETYWTGIRRSRIPTPTRCRTGAIPAT